MKQKTGFVRGIWGCYNIKTDNKLYTRKSKVDKDIKLSLLNPYEPKYKVYIFGSENFKSMTDLGYDCVLLDKKPFVWDMEKEQYRHKLEIWRAGSMDFDEIVFADWDCIPLHKIPDNFWEIFGKGEKIQASIFQYRQSRCNFRPGDTRKVSSAAFVYIRGEDVSNGIIKTWEDIGKPLKEEYALSKYIDDLSCGWKGIEYYKKYEPIFHNIFWHYDAEYYRLKKDPIYCHFNTHRISYFIGEGNKDKIKSRLDAEYKIERERQLKCYKN